MASAAVTPNLQNPIPEDLPKFLHNAKTPWHISPRLFERMTKQYQSEAAAGKPFSAVQVTNQDPEYYFVLRYFLHQKPPHIGIKNILCIHNPDQSKMFEGSLMGMEAAAKTFAPGWKDEEPKAQRAQTMERWKKSVMLFSPFELPQSQRTDKFSESKIVPLWHGSKHIESICKVGFTFFGKHHLFDKTAKSAAQTSTDIGYFGSGIYFTNSSHYASMYNSGTLVLSWVSMREPYPVVNDVPIPQKGSYMKKLQGKHAYQNYNAHYIPVTSIDPKEPQNMAYHPCYQTEQPAWDEYVVFEKNQTLPRFVVELGVDFPIPVSPSVVSSSEKTVGVFIAKLEQLLENSTLKEDSEFVELLAKKLDSLLDLDSDSPISNGEIGFYNRVIRVIDAKGKVNSTYLNLIKPNQAITVAASSKSNSKEDLPSLAKVVKKQDLAPSSSATVSPEVNQKMGYVYSSGAAVSASAAYSATGLIQSISKSIVPSQKPSIAFGAEDWRDYFGDVGQEPPLPANIQEILSSPCPFTKGKKVEETHLLVLIPATLNGQPMTLDRLHTIMLKHSEYIGFNVNFDKRVEYPLAQAHVPFESSHWVMMTKDVIEGSRNKSYAEQQAIVARYPNYQVPRLSEAVTSIFMHYMVTGNQLYGNNPRYNIPETYTSCQEKSVGSKVFVVGGYYTGMYSKTMSVTNEVGVAGLRKF